MINKLNNFYQHIFSYAYNSGDNYQHLINDHIIDKIDEIVDKLNEIIDFLNKNSEKFLNDN